MSMTHTSPGKPLSDRIEYRLYFTLLYPLVLITSFFSRVFARRYTDDRKIEQNLFNQTTASLNATLPWMFMGR